jgi:hypothetical protein
MMNKLYFVMTLFLMSSKIMAADDDSNVIDQSLLWIRVSPSGDTKVIICDTEFDLKQVAIICKLIESSGRKIGLSTQSPNVDKSELLELWLDKLALQLNVKNTVITGLKFESNKSSK